MGSQRRDEGSAGSLPAFAFGLAQAGAAAGSAGWGGPPSDVGPFSEAVRSAGISAPSSSAPATQANPPLTTENSRPASLATPPASTFPNAGAPVTWARYRLLPRPRSWSGV